MWEGKKVSLTHSITVAIITDAIKSTFQKQSIKYETLKTAIHSLFLFFFLGILVYCSKQ